MSEGLDKCKCKLERRYVFISEDDDGFNMEVHPDADSTSVPCRGRVLGPERVGNLWHYAERAFAEADSYCQWFIVRRPLSYKDGRVLGAYVKNPALPMIRKFAITRDEIETRWHREMCWWSQPYEPWQEKVYIAYRVRVANSWRTHRPWPHYFEEWMIEADRLHIPSPTGLLRHCCVADRSHECKGGCRERYERRCRFKKKKPVRLTAKTLAVQLGISERTARRRLREMRVTAYAPVFSAEIPKPITTADLVSFRIAASGGRMRPYFWPGHESQPSVRSTEECREGPPPPENYRKSGGRLRSTIGAGAAGER
jgi:hypothetical protein